MHRFITPLIMLCVTLSAGSRAYATDEPDQLFGPCEGSPDTAVTQIEDADVAVFARVACTAFGHVVMPTDRYIWSFYGEFAPVVLSAQDDGPDAEFAEVHNDVYFTEIEAGELIGEAAQAAFDGARFGEHFPAGVLPRVFAIKTVSNTGVERALYIYQHGTQIDGAIPYPEWFERGDGRPLLPIFVYDRTQDDAVAE